MINTHDATGASADTGASAAAAAPAGIDIRVHHTLVSGGYSRLAP